MNEAAVKWEVDRRGVGSLTFNRPQVNNAYNADLLRGIHEAIDAAERGEGLRVLVLRGEGKHFQGGADLNWLAEVGGQSEAAGLEASRLTAGAVHRLNTAPVPTVALVQGGCIGGGPASSPPVTL